MVFYNVNYFSCPIDFELFRDPVITSCGHTFDSSCLEKFEKHTQASFSCPTDRTPLKKKELRNNLIIKQLIPHLAKKTIPFYLISHNENLKEFNGNFAERIEQENLDDRNKILKILKCPILNEIFVDPFVATCGHTFDTKAFSPDLERKCPIDNTILDPNTAVANILFKSILEELKQQFSLVSCNSKDSEFNEYLKSVCGTWLYLRSDSTKERIEQIAQKLGFCQNKAFFTTINGTILNDEKIEIKDKNNEELTYIKDKDLAYLLKDLKKNPVLVIMDDEIPSGRDENSLQELLQSIL